MICQERESTSCFSESGIGKLCVSSLGVGVLFASNLFLPHSNGSIYIEFISGPGNADHTNGHLSSKPCTEMLNINLKDLTV